MGLTCACLPIRQKGRIVALEYLVDKVLRLRVYSCLGLLFEYVVEMIGFLLGRALIEGYEIAIVLRN